MDLLNEVPITLVVKAPNQKIADQTVECALNWTVRKLKEHLARVYPSNPTENQQKIIYSGKLLQDDVTLKDVLRQQSESETIHTVHLVCSNLPADINLSQNISNLSSSPISMTADGLRNRKAPSPETRETLHDNNQQQREQQQQQHQQPEVPNQSSSLTSNVTERLQFPSSAFHTVHYNPFMSSYLPPGSYGLPGPSNGNSYTGEQMRWLQQQHQAYVQYMTSYMQFFQQGTTAVGQPFNQPIPPFSAAAIPPNFNAAQDLPEIAAEHPVQPQRPPVVRMNAQGGPVNDDDDEMDRDWLDWFYVGVRFALLMCILYFYSTPTRFFITILLMLFVYLFQVGWFRVVGQLRQEAPVVNPPPADGGEQVDGNRSEDPGASAPPEPRAPRGLALAWSVFLAFFTSLAPQPPPPVNAN